MNLRAEQDPTHQNLVETYVMTSILEKPNAFSDTQTL